MVNFTRKLLTTFLAGVIISSATIGIEAQESEELPPSRVKIDAVLDLLLERHEEEKQASKPLTYDEFMKMAENFKKEKEEEAKRLKEEEERLAREEEERLRKIEESYVFMEGHPEQSERKTWMSWRAVTNTSSAQYRFLSKAYIGDYGIMMFNGRYIVALGSYYASYIGEEFIIEFDSGERIPVVVGDFKANAHTDSSNRMALQNRDVVEFIVDTPNLNQTAAIDGSFHRIFEGKVRYIIKTC